MSRDGLSLGYRIGWRVRRIMVTLFGPAQLGSADDPTARLYAEREAKSAQARAKKSEQGR